MKCILLNTGKTDAGSLNEIITDYSKRIGKFISFEIKDIQTNKISGNLPVEKIKDAEATLILKQVSNSDYVILLDEKGKEMTSRIFANKLNSFMVEGRKQVVFISGGAYGFADQVYRRANAKLSLSKMTFTHQLVRLLFVEQLYRALTIIKGLPYHHD